ncbi:S-methyl-5-thioribose kinase [Candidatus Poribacteria bacterium]|nr:S-methyl-5-thioribose kinase [Candidatus Poribacteria bacterium]
MTLNRDNIGHYLEEREAEIGFFATDAKLQVEEIGDGNLNYVYRVYDTSKPESSLVLKQAPPYIKILGPDYPLTSERLSYEARALKVYNRLISDAVPTLYFFDPDSAVIVMEYLPEYRLLRDDLILGKVNPIIPKQIGKFMGVVHSQTYQHNIDKTSENHYRNAFANTDMQAITGNYVFTFPFIEHETNFYTDGLADSVEILKTDSEFSQQAEILKNIFLRVQRGLTHGDLHTGSVMVNDNSAKVIDSEFAFYGSVGFDIGLFWANYLLSYFSHLDASKIQTDIISAIITLWETYIEEFRMDTSLKKRTLHVIFHEAVGFTGMEMLRRIIGAAHVRDIENIGDLDRKLRIEKAILEFGKMIVKKRNHIANVHEMVALL